MNLKSAHHSISLALSLSLFQFYIYFIPFESTIHTGRESAWEWILARERENYMTHPNWESVIKRTMNCEYLCHVNRSVFMWLYPQYRFKIKHAISLYFHSLSLSLSISSSFMPLFRVLFFFVCSFRSGFFWGFEFILCYSRFYFMIKIGSISLSLSLSLSLFICPCLWFSFTRFYQFYCYFPFILSFSIGIAVVL